MAAKNFVLTFMPTGSYAGNSKNHSGDYWLVISLHARHCTQLCGYVQAA
jgi:hypothetical protein